MPTGECSVPDGRSVLIAAGKDNGELANPRFTSNAQIWQIAE